MSFQTIILVVVFVVIGFVLVWSIKNGNNIKFKFKKRDKKKKTEKSDEFKDVIPKEKPEKKEKPATIRKTVKDEKAGKIAPPTNKVMKVTKEDFTSNDLNIPKAFEDKKTAPESKDKEKTFGEKFDEEFDLEKEMRALGITLPDETSKPMDMDFSDDDFLNPYMRNGQPLPDFDFNSELADLKLEDDTFSLKRPMPGPKVEGEILDESLEARFTKVFGDTGIADSTTREIIVGSVMLGNRSRTNRERRKKWLK